MSRRAGCILVWCTALIWLLLPGRKVAYAEQWSEGAALEPHSTAEGSSRGAWLSWQAPPGCPSRDELLDQIVRRVPRALEDSAGVSCDATVQGDPAGFAVQLVVKRAGARGTREVTFTTCNEAAEFVALSIALALDSDATLGEPQSPRASPSAVESVGAFAVPAGPQLSNGSASESPNDAQNSESPSRTLVESGATSPPRANVPAPTARTSTSSGRTEKVSPAHSKSRPLAWFGAFELALMTGMLPTVGVGGSVGVGRAIQAWEVTLAATMLPGENFAVAGAPQEVLFRWVGGTLGVCRVLGRKAASLALCARTTAGALIATEQDAEAPHSGVGGVWGVQAGVEWNLPLSRRWFVHGAGSVNLPLVADTFGFADGTVLYQPTPGFAGALGARYFF